MNIQELRRRLRYFYDEDIGIIVYFVLQYDGETVIKMADIDNESTLPQLKCYFLNSLNNRIIENEELNVMRISQSDERRNILYEYDLEELPEQLSTILQILRNHRQPIFNFNNDNIKNLKGYIILLGDSDHTLLLYKQHYAIYLIKRDNFLFHEMQERLVRFNKDLIRLDDDFQFLSIDNTLFIKDLDKLERFFGFHEVIMREALITIDCIENSDILESTDVLRESIENITFARKLTKLLDNSPVLGRIPSQAIVDFTKTYPALAGKFKYNEDGSRIRLDTRTSQELFIKLLNDNILKSELTNLYYDSLAKDMIEQVAVGTE